MGAVFRQPVRVNVHYSSNKLSPVARGADGAVCRSLT